MIPILSVLSVQNLTVVDDVPPPHGLHLTLGLTGAGCFLAGLVCAYMIGFCSKKVAPKITIHNTIPEEGQVNDGEEEGKDKKKRRKKKKKKSDEESQSDPA